MQHPTKQPLYGHLPSTSQIIQVRQTRQAGHCWKSKDKFKSDVFYGHISDGQSAKTQSHQFYAFNERRKDYLPKKILSNSL